jgi:hypothetical protein
VLLGKVTPGKTQHIKGFIYIKKKFRKKKLN